MKVAMIGAGSIAFARRLLVDILSFPELQESTIALMDIDAERLTLSSQWAHKIVQQERLPTQIITTTDQRAALDGTDYIIW
jgi:alpha-galactosidase